MKTVNRYYYNVCAYIGDSRVMKEILTAMSQSEALAIGRIVLKERGFKLSEVNLEVIRLSRRRMDRLLAPGKPPVSQSANVT
jgi:predicted NAD-dependent protein-ADP-ribosyltransferase YbiA (DUF1768 family)